MLSSPQFSCRAAEVHVLVVPISYRSGAARMHRLDVWWHGRDNNLTELKFINDRQRSPGEFTPPDTLVLHPCGRYCNAFQFAGEMDVLEALEHARKHYPIDGRRMAMRGFSMGGAGCWHLAAHHAGMWVAAAPGAGSAETAEYSRALSKEPKPAWFEQKLWHLGHLSNALQTPKLPDFAILNIAERSSPRSQAGIAAAGFFDEQWQLPK